MSDVPDDFDATAADAPSANRERLDDLLPQIYDDLRKLAARYLRGERAGHTLQPTALVHDAYLRLAGRDVVTWQNRAQLFAVAAQAMRHALVDHARGRLREKRGGGAIRVTLDDEALGAGEPDADLVALDDALRALEALDPQKSRVVELRYFGGLTIEETARVLALSPATVKRDWTLARAWLRRETLRRGGA
jgi:RNA polymerase sigma factor (TIGR02999 family)